MKISRACLTAGIIITAALCSCGGSPAPAGTVAESAAAAEETELTTVTEAPAAELSDRERIIRKSLLSAGNTGRLHKVFAKAAAGDEITVAYIGGSITEGYTLKPEECWAKLIYNYLCEKYPDTKINYVNGGMSGTPSSLGVVRAERDVLAPYGDPDIVFVEFAVNDSKDKLCRESYESLVRRFLALDTEPAVVLLFMRTDTGYSCQEQQSAIGAHYGLPMISPNDALTYAIDEGLMTWADYSNDGAHPNPEGAKLIAEMTERFFELAEAGENDDSAPAVTDVNSVEPLYGAGYVNVSLLDAKNTEPVSIGEYKTDKELLGTFPNGWYRKGGENKGISFALTFESLFLVYHCNKSEKFGTAEVYVDGECAAEIISNSREGWSNPVPRLVKSFDGSGEHTVEVRMKDGDEDSYFGILCLGVTQ
ncbi:MAG: SGNH/GDSL hydrolase family protein [Ruminiclostridium sp.]|nr:SGNH/GDSL hydrolase family protein [Ruminiclostridium sp.]